MDEHCHEGIRLREYVSVSLGVEVSQRDKIHVACIEVVTKGVLQLISLAKQELSIIQE